MKTRQMNFAEETKNFLSTIVPDYFLSLQNRDIPPRIASAIPRIAVLGTDIPEIYFRAAGSDPVYIPEGLYATSEYAEKNFPQICDPAVKSAVGYLTKGSIKTSDFGAVALSDACMDARKASQFLKAYGFPVIMLEEGPALASDLTDTCRYHHNRFLKQLEPVTGHKITRVSLRDAARRITAAHKLLDALSSLSVPQTAVDYICQTYYMADDKDEWMMRVQRFIEAHPQKQAGENKLLLIGSPIYFPNIKLPKILSDLGMTHYENRCGVRIPPDYSSVCQGNMSVSSMLKRIQEIHYEIVKADSAIQIINNGGSLDRYQGVIYHVLKGQLNYAYEAERLEKAAIKKGIPFVCIETDYTNADVEQIRIRLEAFSELLKSDPSHKRSISKGELS